MNEVDLQTAVNDLMETFANSDISLVLLLDRHDPLDLPLALFYCTLHLLMVAAHLGNQLFVMSFLADD